MPLFPSSDPRPILVRLRDRIARHRREARPIAEKFAPITDADDLESVSQQLKKLLPQQKGRPMRNWLTGFVATTGFKYLVTMIAQFIAVKLGVDQGALEGLIAQLVAVIMGAWGMYESSKSKIVVAGVKQTIPNDATPTEAKAIAAAVINKAEDAK
jgi:hypothetical protein